MISVAMNLANSMLQCSKFTHDIAINSLIAYSHMNIPAPWNQFTDNAVESTVIIGDSIGHMLLVLYIMFLKGGF